MAIRFFALILCFGVAISLAGCGEPANDTDGSTDTSHADHEHGEDGDHDHGDHDHGDHDHGDHDHGEHAGHEGHDEATTIEGAMSLLETHALAIKTAMAKDDADMAHGPLHDVGNTIGAIEKMAASVELDEDAKVEVATAVTDLFASFGALDGMFHGGDEVGYAEVEDKINAAISVLKEKLQ